jgi:hypothetical protein
MGRRAALAAAATAMAVGALGMATGSASATGSYNRDGNYDIPLYGAHGVGVYQGAQSNQPKVAADLFAPASVSSDCWVSGENINNIGNVWYHVYQEHYSNGSTTYQYGYVYAPFVDNSDTWRYTGLPHCPWA